MRFILYLAVILLILTGTLTKSYSSESVFFSSDTLKPQIKKMSSKEDTLIITKKRDNIALTIFPNPFNQVTTISFTLEMQDTVTVKVYDVEGRELKTILKQFPLTKGEQILEFDKGDIEPGFYLIQLMSKKKLFGKKVVIIN